MSNIKRVFKTPKGTEIPLLNLKGKEYLQVAHRLIILDETYESYTVNTELIQVSDVSAVSKATIIVFDKNTGKVLRSVTSTKRETQKDFPDFIEKAETGSIGRALALIGIGTQFCTQDMDEGMRLADSPVFSREEVRSVSKDEPKQAMPDQQTTPVKEVVEEPPKSPAPKFVRSPARKATSSGI